jgi:hypothetical protein
MSAHQQHLSAHRRELVVLLLNVGYVLSGPVHEGILLVMGAVAIAGVHCSNRLIDRSIFRQSAVPVAMCAS